MYGNSIAVIPVILAVIGLQFTSAQVDIHKQSEYVTQDRNDEALEKEIYTSMHELVNFFTKEREYIDDLRIIMEKKLVSIDAQGAVGAYIASYEDIIGEQVEMISIIVLL